ncbi:hypothetical protein DSO57_1003361 [Entomophthora muscae]|uniref:Uncharacterized protein n=1 Tax=Entomophthora muscae TaxID=34485 RepID=A0ACC2SY09_9FUNG|nr:hypothetical protein DSO57_1003361 [Entomophthora muscae]
MSLSNLSQRFHVVQNVLQSSPVNSSFNHTQKLRTLLLSLQNALNQTGRSLTEASEEQLLTSLRNPELGEKKVVVTRNRSLTNDFDDMSKLVRVLELKASLKKELDHLEKYIAVEADEPEGLVPIKLTLSDSSCSNPQLSPTIDSSPCDSFSDVSDVEDLALNSIFTDSLLNASSLKISPAYPPTSHQHPLFKTPPSTLRSLNSRDQMPFKRAVRSSGIKRMGSSPNLRQDAHDKLSVEFSSLAIEDQGSENDFLSIGKSRFALNIVVGDPSRVGQGYRSFTVYTCQALGIDGKKYTVHKRYSDFEKLRGVLLKVFPEFKKFVPQLPQKKVVGKFEASFVESRRQGLEHFLAYVCLHPVIGTCPAISRWFSQ